MKKCILTLLILAGCVDSGPVYVPQYQPMDATPYMRPVQPQQQPMKVCPGGLIVPVTYFC